MDHLRTLVFGEIPEFNSDDFNLRLYQTSDYEAFQHWRSTYSGALDLAILSSSEAGALKALEYLKAQFRDCTAILVAEAEDKSLLIRALELGLDRHILRVNPSENVQDLLQATLKAAGQAIETRHLDREKWNLSLARLRHADRTQGTARIAREMAHDFNNLLTVISSYGYMMKAGLADHPDLSRNLSKIIEAAQRGAILTRQLVAVRRQPGKEYKNIDLNQQIPEIITTLQTLAGKNISIKFEPSTTSNTILCEPGRIQQILINLTANARDAMVGGGEITLRTYLRHDALRHNTKQAQAVLEFQDTGHGIQEEIKAQIFEPFFTTHHDEEANGLGLSIVKELVDEDRGSVEIESTAGEGTTVRLSWPYVQEALAGAVRTSSTRHRNVR